ncbi:MAG: preprotein translocase subunit SecY [Erysipelotrichaceae bacterium]|jgi:preprotein translocase subunit SecY|nr:preprotein translocase subunit SecY [Erysipelotrichaceae bacterium]
MIKRLTAIMKNPEIRNRILFTLAVMFVFRFGAAIPAPNIDSVKLLGGVSSNSVFALVNMLGGGSIQSFSIFSLGVGPYITASIVVQMLAMDVIPALTEMSKSGEKGKKQLDQITRYMAVVLCFIQAFVLTYGFDQTYGIVITDNFKAWQVYIYVAVVQTAGSLFLCWLGDRISFKGIGNGISMLIMAGIVANIPAQFYSIYTAIMGINVANPAMGYFFFGLYVLAYLLIIVLVVFMNQATRKIPIQYTSSSVVANKNDMTFIPLKINSASVIPVIFASALMTAPTTIANFFTQNKFTEMLSTVLNYRKPIGLVIYIILIFAFTYFYTNLQVDPEKMADNLKKNGSYVLGITPGADTKNYISVILNRITTLGALGLALIAAIPPLLSIFFPALPETAHVFGTGIIIVIGVALETNNDIEGRLAQRSHYQGFVKK